MSQINPFIGAVSVTPQLQRLQAADKALQVQRLQTQSKNAAGGESLDHQVESADAIVSIHDDHERPPEQQQKKQQPHDPAPAPETSKDDATTHLDLTA